MSKKWKGVIACDVLLMSMCIFWTTAEPLLPIGVLLHSVQYQWLENVPSNNINQHYRWCCAKGIWKLCPFSVDHDDVQFFRAVEWLMFFFKATIDFDRFSMVLTPLDHWMFFWGPNHCHQWFFNGFLICYHCFQWFSMVTDHWSNDAMVSKDRCGLIQCMFPSPLMAAHQWMSGS